MINENGNSYQKKSILFNLDELNELFETATFETVTKEQRDVFKEIMQDLDEIDAAHLGTIYTPEESNSEKD